MDAITPGDQDNGATIAELRAMVRAFVSERNWERHHAPKNLAMALAVEASELMEHFQWLSVEESRAIREDDERLSAVCEELADVFCYVLAMANSLDIDLTSRVRAKMAKNRIKYPTTQPPPS